MKSIKTKHRIIKAVSALTALVLASGMLAGCGGSSDKDSEGRTIISVGSWPPEESDALTAMNERKARFEEANPDVVIEPDEWAFDRQTFYAKAAGGQLPTVYLSGFTEMPEIINSGYSSDITEALKNNGLEGMFNENIMDIISRDGKIYAFPTMSYVLGLAYNVDAFEAAGLMKEDGTPMQPANWDEMVDFAVKIKEATGKPGIVLPTADRSGGWIFSAIAWSFGVEFMEKGEDGKWQAKFDSPEAAQALQFIKDLKWKYDLLPASTIINAEDWYRSFAVGDGAMTVVAGDYPRRVAKYGMTPDQSGIMAIPAGPAKHVTLLGGEVMCIKNDATPDQIDASVRWLKTRYNNELTDEYKTNTETTTENAKKDGQLVGIQSLSPWSDKAESLVWYRDYIEQNANCNLNHVKLYNDFVADCPAEIKPEEPVCCQELYAVLDSCIQEVLTDENADCAQIMSDANSDFQMNYLDNLAY